MQLIFRDDDTSFFTTPAMLEEIYEPLWDRGVPVCLAVIPAHYGNIWINGEIDPNIAPQYRGQDRDFPITDNPELCAFLNNQVKQGLVEICLHGYNHNYPEFQTDDAALIQQKLTDGRRILETAFPDAAINTFLIPYDAISAAALALILEAGYNTCIDPRNIPDDSALKGGSFYRVQPQANAARLFTSGPAGYDHELDAWRETLQDGSNTLVVLNHYYMFYDNFGTIRAPMQIGWRSAVNDLLDDYAAHVTTFAKAQPDMDVVR